MSDNEAELGHLVTGRSLADFAEVGLAAVRAAKVPYPVVAGADLERDYQKWLGEMLPQGTATVCPLRRPLRPRVADDGVEETPVPTRSLAATGIP